MFEILKKIFINRIFTSIALTETFQGFTGYLTFSNQTSSRQINFSIWDIVAKGQQVYLVKLFRVARLKITVFRKFTDSAQSHMVEYIRFQQIL